MLRLANATDTTELAKVCAGLADLVEGLNGCSGFTAGTNRDFEGKSAGYDFGFMLDAQDEAALTQYAEHPQHKILGAQLISICRDGADGIAVYDLDAGE